MQKRKLYATVLLLTLLVGVCGCSTPQNIKYFQDATNISEVVTSKVNDIRVKQGDKLTVIVKSSEQNLSNQFNLNISNNAVSSVSSLPQYTVDDKGNIDFPVVGSISVVGLKRTEIAYKIKDVLIQQQLVTDPVVTVEFGNLYYSVLGEVNHPGAFEIKHDQVSILDAIGTAGDLSIMGDRTDVLVIREEEGLHKTYHIDLTRLGDVYSSPAYYLQQKDVVYVSPNETRARQSTVNGNNVRSTSFWISISSMALTVATFLVNILK